MGSLSTVTPSGWLEVRDWPDGKKGSLMDRLFNRLDGTYPNRWRAAFGNDAAIANWREAWAEAFAEERITPDEIKRGIVECRKRHDWPPSLPEFLRACRPPLDHEASFAEAVKQMRLRHEDGTDQWSSPAIYWAAVKIGDFDLRSMPYQSLKGKWEKALADAMAAIKSGARPNEVPPHRIALPAPGQTSLSPEDVAKRLAAVRAVIAKVTTIPGGAKEGGVENHWPKNMD